MSIRIQHRVGVAASAERVWEIIADLDGWSAWNPLHPRAAGRIAIGGELNLIEAIEGETPREVTVRVPDWTPEQQLIWTHRRGFLSSSTRYFEIEALSSDGCILANGEIFEGLLGESWAARRRGALRGAFEAVNEAVKARAEAR